ncbi:MAG: molybdopterin-synthase adenylyltransferase MoeB [Pseudomonadota bacterium]
MALTPEETRRYDRHLILDGFGPKAQEKLRNSSALLVGAGGLGSPVALYLAAAGIGRLGIVEFDRVDESNLHRQILYRTPDIGHPKTEAVKERLGTLNPGVRLELHDVKLTQANAEELLRNYDVIVDGTDNYPARYVLHDTAVRLGKPSVYGAVLRFEGQVSVFDAKRGPCYRCLYPVPPETESIPGGAQAGIFGVLPGVIGTIQATETVKLLLGLGEPLIGRLLIYDALKMEFRELALSKKSTCVVCSKPRTN